MAEIRKLAEFGMHDGAAPKGALAEAAQRLDRVASVVKDQQLARTKSGARAPESETFILSPEEAWSKKYMTQCIGPVCTIWPTAEGAAILPGFAPKPKPQAAAIQAVFEAKVPESKPMMPARGRRKGKVAPDPIGLAIGKPARRRSWLGRIFLG